MLLSLIGVAIVSGGGGISTCLHNIVPSLFQPRHDRAGATGETGPWAIGLDMPSYLPAMQFLKSRGVREQLYRAFVKRASEGEHDNAANVQKARTGWR